MDVAGSLHVAERAKDAAARRLAERAEAAGTVVDVRGVVFENALESANSTTFVEELVVNCRVRRAASVAESVTERTLLNSVAFLEATFSPAVVGNILKEVDEVRDRIPFMSHDFSLRFFGN